MPGISPRSTYPAMRSCMRSSAALERPGPLAAGAGRTEVAVDPVQPASTVGTSAAEFAEERIGDFSSLRGSVN